MNAYGHKGEELAAQYFLRLGYKILARNFRNRRAEIDLVAYRQGILVFVEVKARNPPILFDPILTLGGEKRRRLRYGAQLFLSTRKYIPQYQEIRFDFVAITASRVEKHHEAVFFL